MHKLTASVFSFLLVLTCSVFAQENAVETAPVEAVAEETANSSTAPAAEPKKLSNEQIAKIIAHQNPYPKYLAAGMYLRSSYAPSNGGDLGIGFMFPLSKSWPVSVGFEPFHLQIGAKDFQIVSDETLWIAAAGLVFGAMGPLFRGPEAPVDTTAKTPEKPGIGKSIFAVAVLVPMYALCGSFYIPVVPGAWLGILDRSRLNTQLISEGFHKRSFTYMNDVGLRLSPLASSDGVLHGFMDGGVRFEKNFDAHWKYNYFAQLGFSLSFY